MESTQDSLPSEEEIYDAVLRQCMAVKQLTDKFRGRIVRSDMKEFVARVKRVARSAPGERRIVARIQSYPHHTYSSGYGIPLIKRITDDAIAARTSVPVASDDISQTPTHAIVNSQILRIKAPLKKPSRDRRVDNPDGTAVLLEEDNWHEWRHCVERELRDRGLWLYCHRPTSPVDKRSFVNALLTGD